MWVEVKCRYYTNFKWPYFHTAGGYGHMVRHAGGPICIAHTDVTLTWSKVKVTDLLHFRKLHFSTSTCSAIWGGAHNWWVITIVWDLVYSFSEPDFLISPPVGGHESSKFAKCWYNQNPLRFVSLLAKARSLWLRLQVGSNKLCTLVAMTVSPLVGLFLFHCAFML